MPESDGLLLDFPRKRLSGSNVLANSPPCRVAAPPRPEERDEWELAKALLQESVDKAWLHLNSSPVPPPLGHADAEDRLRHTLAAASKLLNRPGTMTQDFLNYLADVEAGLQLLSAPLDLHGVESDLARLRILALRLRERGRDASTECVADAALLRKGLEAQLERPGGDEASCRLFKEFASICKILDELDRPSQETEAHSSRGKADTSHGKRSVGAQLNDFLVQDNSSGAVASSSTARDSSGYLADSSGSVARTFGADPSTTRLQEWNSNTSAFAGLGQLTILEDQDEEDDVVTRRRLGQLAVEARALADAQREVANLAVAAVDTLDATETSTTNTVAETKQAVRELGVAARKQAGPSTVKTGIGGAAAGAAVGACIAGPVGAAVGAGVTAGLGAIAARRVRANQIKSIDRLVASAESPP